MPQNGYFGRGRNEKSLGTYTTMKTTTEVSFSEKDPKKNSRKRTYILAFVVFLAILIVAVVILQFYIKGSPGFQGQSGDGPLSRPCSDSCTIAVVESIPESLTYPAGEVVHPSVYSGWMQLMMSAKHSIDIASSYWTLRGVDTDTDDPSTKWGETIYQELIKAGKRGVKIRIVQSATTPDKNKDTQILAEMGVAEVRSLNLSRLIDSGILHTKMWLVDGKHFYLGSANLDWRSLTQVKEMGLMTYNCSCLAEDISKIFEAYWFLGTPTSEIPSPWPHQYQTGINKDTPATIIINTTHDSSIFLSSSPPELCPSGRTADLDAILYVINTAKKFIYIEVMDYFPTTLYKDPRTYWPVIDDALRKAAFDRHVHVRLLAGLWKHTRPDLKNFLKSLAAINGSNYASVETRFFKVPIYTDAQSRIPYARVNHDKFMVTDNTAYIGTSNWAADYFLYTGGIGYIISEHYSGPTSVRGQIQAVFERDWNSKYIVNVV